MPANWPHCFNQQLTDPCLETKLSELLADMSLAQKVGQMIQPDIRYITPAEVGEYQIGSVLSGLFADCKPIPIVLLRASGRFL